MAPQTAELELLLGKNQGFHPGCPSVLVCRLCVRRAAVPRKVNPCRGCQSRGGESQCGRGSPRSRWSGGRPNRGSSSRMIRRRECPLFNVSQAQWVSSRKTETKQERGRKKETGGRKASKAKNCYSVSTHQGQSLSGGGVGRTWSCPRCPYYRAKTEHAWQQESRYKVSLSFCQCKTMIYSEHQPQTDSLVALCGLYSLDGQLCYGQ